MTYQHKPMGRVCIYTSKRLMFRLRTDADQRGISVSRLVTKLLEELYDRKDRLGVPRDPLEAASRVSPFIE